MPHQHSVDGFKIVEIDKPVTDGELDDLVFVTEESLRNESMFQLRVRELSDEQRDAWIRKHWLEGPLNLPHFRAFAIRDLASSKLIGYTALQCPASREESEKQQAMHKQGVTADVIGPEGRAFIEAFGAELRSLTSKHGYDPEKHFHKRNTLLRPEYHRRGLGTWLTEYCNDIADQAGRATYCNARPKAWKMLETTGFRLVDEVSIDASKFGWDEVAVVRYFKREPQNDEGANV